VSQVCDTLEQAGDTCRLARFLWSLPTDARSTAEFERHEPVLRARAVVAYHAGQYHQLYRILTTHRFHTHTHSLTYSLIQPLSAVLSRHLGPTIRIRRQLHDHLFVIWKQQQQ